MIFGVDFGSSRTRIYKRGAGLLFDEPTLLCKEGEEFLYFGEKALAARHRSPKHFVFFSPIQRGLIENPEVAVSFLEFCLAEVDFHPSFRPDVYSVMPIGASPLYRTMHKKVFSEVGFRQVHIVDAVTCVARSLGSHERSFRGWFIVHIGAGHTDVGLVSMGELVDGETLPQGSEDLNLSIQEAVQKKFRVKIGCEAAEALKREISCLYSVPPVFVRGISMETGLPTELAIASEQVVEAFTLFLTSLFRLMRKLLARTPPELCADIVEHGIVLSGGGSGLRHLDQLMAKFFNIPVVIASGEPVIHGLAQCVESTEYSLLHFS